MSVLMSIFLGLVQGFTEFLPVSSSGHLSIIQNIFKTAQTDEGHLFFDVLLHLGTFISICIVYRADIKAMISDSLEYLNNRADGDDDAATLKPSVRMTMLIIFATLPLVLAYFFSSGISQLFYKTGFIGFALLVSGALLYISEKLVKTGNKTERTMTVGDALVIGLAQAIATIPGLSRSGTTISVGLARGLSRDFTVRFSLLLSLPAVFCAMIATFFQAVRAGIDWAMLPLYLAGFVVAATVGYFSIMMLRGLLKKGNLRMVAYYCWGMGILAIILSIVV